MNLGRTTYPSQGITPTGLVISPQEYRDLIKTDDPIPRELVMIELYTESFTSEYSFNPYTGVDQGAATKRLFTLPGRIPENHNHVFMPLNGLEEIIKYQIDNSTYLRDRITTELKTCTGRFFRIETDRDEDSISSNITLIGTRLETDDEWETRRGWIESRRDVLKKQQAKEQVEKVARQSRRAERERLEYERLKAKFEPASKE